MPTHRDNPHLADIEARLNSRALLHMREKYGDDGLREFLSDSDFTEVEFDMLLDGLSIDSANLGIRMLPEL